jgi:hypothetical protein
MGRQLISIYSKGVEPMRLLRVGVSLFLLLVMHEVSTNAQWVKTLPVVQDHGDFVAFAVLGTSIFAGSERSGVFRSTDNGTSWTAVNSGLPDSAVFSLVVSGTNLFAGTSNGGVYLSSNNGTTWTGANSRLGIRNVSALAASPDGAGGTNLFAGTYGGVYLSTNNGTSWTVADTVNGDEGIHSLLVSGTNIFAVIGPEITISSNSASGILLSTNNGASWTELKSGLPDFAVLSVAVSGTNLFAGGNGVNLSTNNGTTWTMDTLGMGSAIVLSLTVSGTNVFAGTYSRGVYRSTNNHTGWTAVNSGLPVGNSSYIRALISTGMYLFAGTHDGVWRRPLSELVTQVTEVAGNSIPVQFELAQNYPNPFNPATTFSFSLPSKSFVSLKVFDALGREVASVASEEMTAGSHTMRWDAGKVPSGIYYYRLQARQTSGGQAGAFTETRKAVLVK